MRGNTLSPLDLRGLRMTYQDIKSLDLSKLAVLGEMPVEIHDAIKHRVELALTYLEDGARHTAAVILREFLGIEFLLKDCLLKDHGFQFQGKVYEQDPRTGYCYRLDDPRYRDIKAAWQRISQKEYAEERAACIEAVKKQGGSI